VADRMFRTFETIVLPVRCSWIATGNNVQLGGDMPRRCYWVRLDAKSSQPFRRTGFRHENLAGWVAQNRGELIRALLTIARYWYLQGQPKAKSLKPLGSYESWCLTIGGMLELAGVEGFLGNAATMFEQADPEAVQWEIFLLALDDVFGSQPFKVGDLVERLAPSMTGVTEVDKISQRLRDSIPDSLADAADRTTGAFRKRLGTGFSERVGRRFGDSQIYIDRAGQDRKAKVYRWRVIRP
jgi:hypothetical protein